MNINVCFGEQDGMHLLGGGPIYFHPKCQKFGQVWLNKSSFTGPVKYQVVKEVKHQKKQETADHTPQHSL